MKRIRAIRELEELVAIQESKGYMVRLNYRLLPPLKAQYGEDGCPAGRPDDALKNPLQQGDLSCRSNTWMTIGAFQFRD